MITRGHIPDEVATDVARGERLARWTLFWIGGISILMYLVMGSSQAMKTALFEDVLSLIPSMAFLVATRFERKGATPHFPFGFKRVNSLAFLIAAVALLSIGGFLAFEAVMALIAAEHPTVGGVTVFGQTIWLGWLMIAALLYSAIPPLILGRKKLPVARTIADKVLHTDALTQKADWQTALAGVLGIVGIGFGLWWADAAAALFISLSILKDGADAMSKATGELIDGVPRAMEHKGISDDAQHLLGALRKRHPHAEIRLRESGRYILAEIVAPDIGEPLAAETLMPVGRAWRLSEVSFHSPLADRR